MNTLSKRLKLTAFTSSFLYLVACVVYGWLPSPVSEEASVFMPGSQPDASAFTLESVETCNNCHAGFDAPTNPYHAWQGSMMAHAARDPLWIASLAVANQDAIWALGSPNAADLCVRCHSPAGWLGGRSDPPNLSLFTQQDKEGVSCSSCHRMVDPLTVLGQPDVGAEDPPVPTLVSNTRTADLAMLSTIKLFDQVTPFLDAGNLPLHYGDGTLPNYIEATGGQFFIDRESRDIRRGPLTDPNTSHGWLYSRYHKSRNFCATCHDVSNAVLANLDSPGTSERQASATYYHAERTFSEFLLSDFGNPGGAATSTAFANARGITHASTCQDCHMPKADGKVAKRGSSPVRSQVATHDLTGANTWMMRMLASADNNAPAPTRDQWNIDLFSGNNPNYPGATIELDGLLDTSQMLLDGATRGLLNLSTAASIEIIDETSSTATLRIVNHTGHKLISGYPEGRRMWLNVEFIGADGSQISQINGYQSLAISEDSSGDPHYISGAVLSHTREDLIYEAKLQNPDLLPNHTTTFHFLLGSSRYKDNRIPPRGFDVIQAAQRLCLPVWEGIENGNYFTAAEYAGGYDEINIQKPPGTKAWVAHLYYQTTSKEYVTFLRDEINGSSTNPLASPTPSGESQAYVIQSDPYFANLKDWGNAIWDLWLHNGGAPPEIMTTTIGEHMAPHASVESDGIHLSFPSLPNMHYQVQSSPDLSDGSWLNLGEPMNGNGTVLTFIDPNTPASGKMFYRLAIKD
jgi:hypothetical protein